MIQHFIAEKILEVEKAYAGQSGGEGVCQLHKDGRVSGGLKYEEGRLVALLWSKREFSREDLSGFSKLLHSEILVWQKELELLRQRQSPSLPWLAYRQGGLDALQFVAGLLR